MKNHYKLNFYVYNWTERVIVALRCGCVVLYVRMSTDER